MCLKPHRTRKETPHHNQPFSNPLSWGKNWLCPAGVKQATERLFFFTQRWKSSPVLCCRCDAAESLQNVSFGPLVVLNNDAATFNPEKDMRAL